VWLSGYHKSITLTQSHVPSVNTQLHSNHIIIYTVTRTVSKYIVIFLSFYHINFTFTQSHVSPRSAAIQPLFTHCAFTWQTKMLF